MKLSASARARWAAIARWAVPAALLLVLILAIYWRLWTPRPAQRRTFGWDAIWENWGDVKFQVDALAHGRLPLWNPYDRLGYPFHADPQTGTLYPPQWTLWLIAFVIGSAPWWLVAVKVVMHVWIGGFGMYVLCTRRGLPAAAGALAAVLFVTSWEVIHNIPSALNWSFAWTPWLLLAIDGWTERPGLPRAAWLALAAAMGVLAGGLASFWYGLLVAVPWAMIELRRRWREHGPGYPRAIASSGAAALALFALVVAAQLTSTLPLIGDTVRDARGAEFINSYPTDPIDLVGFVAPWMPGKNSYVGIIAILFAGVALAVRPTVRKGVLAAVVVLAVVCSMGWHTPVLVALAKVLPPFGMFRSAHRYMYASIVPLGVLAAEGLALLLTTDDARSRARLRLGVSIAAGAGAAVLAYAWWSAAAPPMRAAFKWGTLSALVAAAAAWAALYARGRLRALAGAVVLAALFDLWLTRAQKVPDSMAPPPIPHHDDLVRVPDLPLAHRIYDRGFLGFRPGIRLGVRDVGGYEGDPLALWRYERLRQAIVGAPRQGAHAGVAYYFETGETTTPKSSADLAVMTRRAPGAWQLAGAVAAVRWYDRATLVADAPRALAATLASPPGTIAVLEAPTLDAEQRARAERVDAAPADAAPVDGALVELEPEHLRATVHAPADGVVVINEMFYARGWSATVDGADAAIVPAQGFARAVLVGPGDHVIEMQYRAPRYLALAAVELATLGGIGFVIVRARRRDRTRPRDRARAAEPTA